MARRKIFLIQPIYRLPNFLIDPIVHINFINLISLDLLDAGEINIQSLAFLNAPQLATIDLNCSPIMTLKPFAKCYFSNLQFMHLTTCIISPHQIKNLNRTHLKKDLNYLQLSSFEQASLIYQLLPKFPKFSLRHLSLSNLQRGYIYRRQKIQRNYGPIDIKNLIDQNESGLSKLINHFKCQLHTKRQLCNL